MTRSYDTEGLVEACGAATLEERHQLLTMMLDAVYGGHGLGPGIKSLTQARVPTALQPGRARHNGILELVTGGMEQA